MKRELAWRVFSGEYNDSSFEIKGFGEKTPSYVITPLGGYVNRLYIVGVLTDVENVSEGGDFVRAHISDPTGVFTLYSGQFQQEITDQLLNIDVPAFVAVVGKIRTYKPDDGELIVSIRPEIIREVSADTRIKWILETCRQTKFRIDALSEAMKMSDPNALELRKLGYSKELSEGIVAALKEYQSVDVGRYISFLREALAYIVPSKETQIEDHRQDEIIKTEKPKEKVGSSDVEDAVEDSEKVENTIFEIIKKLDKKDDGVAWDLIMENCKKEGLTEDLIEEALTSLMDKGFIFEPVLGTIKTT